MICGERLSGTDLLGRHNLIKSGNGVCNMAEPNFILSFEQFKIIFDAVKGEPEFEMCMPLRLPQLHGLFAHPCR